MSALSEARKKVSSAYEKQREARDEALAGIIGIVNAYGSAKTGMQAFDFGEHDIWGCGLAFDADSEDADSLAVTVVTLSDKGQLSFWGTTEHDVDIIECYEDNFTTGELVKFLRDVIDELAGKE